jgi:hypothetical protein
MRAAGTLAMLCACLWLAACSEAPPPEPPSPAAVAPPPRAAIPPEDLYVLAVGGNGFRASMTLQDLQARFGVEQVAIADVPMGEGTTETGAVIHGDDPSRRAYVYFVDGNPQATVSAIYVRDAQSIWRGPMGLRLGTSSIELDRMNGRSFRFLGFGWDYGGYVSNWAEGNLARALLPPGQLALRLAPPELAEDIKLPSGYPAGDSEFTSDLPSIHERPPVVIELGLAFVPAAEVSVDTRVKADTP